MARFNKASQRMEADLHGPGETPKSSRSSPPIAAVKGTALSSVPTELAHDEAINSLTEQLSALTLSRERVCVHVVGCRVGDGASAVAAAIAFDLSQRLGLNTILVDGHLRHPSLHHLLLRADAGSAYRSGELLKRVLSTGWPRLDLAVATGVTHSSELIAEFNALLADYAIAVVDLGVARLDPTVLSFAKPGDPILLVVRQGHTERRDLITAISILAATGQSAVGVVFNAARSSIPRAIRRILGMGV